MDRSLFELYITLLYFYADFFSINLTNFTEYSNIITKSKNDLRWGAKKGCSSQAMHNYLLHSIVCCVLFELLFRLNYSQYTVFNNSILDTWLTYFHLSVQPFLLLSHLGGHVKGENTYKWMNTRNIDVRKFVHDICLMLIPQASKYIVHVLVAPQEQIYHFVWIIFGDWSCFVRKSPGEWMARSLLTWRKQNLLLLLWYKQSRGNARRQTMYNTKRQCQWASIE